MDNETVPGAGPLHGQQHSQVRARKFQINVRLRRSQLQAVISFARKFDLGATSFMRSSGLRRAQKDKPKLDPTLKTAVWCDADELAAIKAAAERAHVTPSAYIRESTMSCIADLATKASIASPATGALGPANRGTGGHQPEGRSRAAPAPPNNGGIGIVR